MVFTPPCVSFLKGKPVIFDVIGGMVWKVTSFQGSLFYPARRETLGTRVVGKVEMSCDCFYTTGDADTSGIRSHSTLPLIGVLF